MESPADLLNQSRIDYGSTTRDSVQKSANFEKEDNPNYYRFASERVLNLSRRKTKFPYSRGMEIEIIPKKPLFSQFEFAVSILNQILIGFITIYMSWMCLRTGLTGTALHAWLVTIGFSFLMCEGIMCHYSGNVLTNSYKRTTKTTIHWILQALGGGIGVAGTLIKCFQKGFLLQSLHGKLGFSAMIICLVSMITGLSSLYASKFKVYISPLYNKMIHNFLGIATLTIGLLAQYYGYKTGFFRRKTDLDFQTLMQCITLISLVLTCIGPLKALYNKVF